jgi:hypothetical protein
MLGDAGQNDAVVAVACCAAASMAGRHVVAGVMPNRRSNPGLALPLKAPGTGKADVLLSLKASNSDDGFGLGRAGPLDPTIQID